VEACPHPQPDKWRVEPVSRRRNGLALTVAGMVGKHWRKDETEPSGSDGIETSVRAGGCIVSQYPYTGSRYRLPSHTFDVVAYRQDIRESISRHEQVVQLAFSRQLTPWI
jgi:hypothetical protein